MKILIGGSRVGAPLAAVRNFVIQSLRFGRQVVVSTGCAAGADQAAIQAALALGAAGQLSVAAVGGPGGLGFWSGSACAAVRLASLRGASVSWWAGGQLSVPLVGRLSARSKAALVGCAAAFFFCAPGGSAGSLKTAAVAAARGVPVYFFNNGQLPALPGQAGSWSPVSMFGMSFLLWVPAFKQNQLFSEVKCKS